MSWLSKNKEKLVGLVGAFIPQVKTIGALLGVGAATVVAMPETAVTVEQKLAVLGAAIGTWAAKQIAYLVKDFLDNGKFDKSVKE